MSAKNSKYAGNKPPPSHKVASGAPFGGRQFNPAGVGACGSMGGPSGTAPVQNPTHRGTQPSANSSNAKFKTLSDL